MGELGVWGIPDGRGESLGQMLGLLCCSLLGMVVQASHPSTWQEETGAEGHLFKANLDHRIPQVKKNKEQEAGKMAQ